MGDVTYGACCIDDLSARALGCELLVHYGHSCLVPVDTTAIAVLYVFVEIGIDVDHFVQTVQSNVPHSSRLALLGTVQFLKAMHSAKPRLAETFAAVGVPQAKPLSAGETLGCTAPRLKQGEVDFMVFLADGRFHPEAAMIHNPEVPLLRYDPYARLLTREEYDHTRMLQLRARAVHAARDARCFGLVLGTLGRQGNPAILDHLRALLTALDVQHIVVLLSELFPAKLSMFAGVDAWVQVACPRLSIDWGHGFTVPVLTPYEAEVALGARDWQPVYPMSYYAREGGSFANYAADAERAATREACSRKRDCAAAGADGLCGPADAISVAAASSDS
jgi:2-(3-amino-3-carboxypropyl)histidine synthase